MSLDAIRKRARQLERKVLWRNAREYAAAVVVFAAFGMSAWREANAVILVGDGLIDLATIFVVYHLRARGSVRTMTPDLVLTACLHFHRAELIRQRDLVQGVWWWYLFPFVPGVA